MQDLKFQNQAKNDKKEIKSSYIQQVFVCVCGKQYKSFPALYLHNKNKHQTTIKICQKETMTQRSAWSGKKKKIIYEFPEEKWLIENNSGLKSHQSSNEVIKIQDQKKSEETFKLYNLQRVLRLFSIYIEQNSHEFQKTWVQLVLNQLIVCYRTKFDVIFKDLKVDYDLNEKDNCNLLPFVFNFFSIEYSVMTKIPEIKFSLKLTRILLLLSEWLFREKFCQNKAVVNEPFWSHFNSRL